MTRTSVAVDVGNCAVKARFFRLERDQTIPLGQPVHVSLQTADWRESFAGWYGEQLSTIVSAENDSVQWRVASVNPPPTQLLKAWVETVSKGSERNTEVTSHRRTAAERHHWHEVSFRDIPLKLDVRHPEALGIDRLVAAWAAWHGRWEMAESADESKWTFVAEQQRRARPVIVVDAGTALTVDLVDTEGTFCGGAILPGRQMQLRSLGLGAFALPDLSQRAETRPDAMRTPDEFECPGRDTQSAIQLGVFAGMVGAIEHLREAYRQSAGEIPDLILSGGDAALLAPAFGGQARWVPHLVLDGLAWLGRS